MIRGQTPLLVAALVALFLSIGVGVVGAQQSPNEQSPSIEDGVTIVDTQFEVVNRGPGTGSEEANVEYDRRNLTVTVDGQVTGSNSCYTAELRGTSYSSSDDTLYVSVVPQSKDFQDTLGACADVIIDINYRVVVEFEGGLPGDTQVTTSPVQPFPPDNIENMSDYRNTQNEVDLSGLQTAIEDFVNDEIDLSSLQNVIEEYVAS